MKLIRNFGWSLSAQAVLLVLGCAATRYIYRGLGGDSLGLLILAATIASVVCGLGELGVNTCVVRELAANSDAQYRRDLVGSAAFVLSVMYVVMTLAAWMAAPSVVTRWIHLTTLDHATAIRLLRTLLAASMLALPRSLCIGVLRGLERMDWSSSLIVTPTALQYGGTFLLVVLGRNLDWIVYWIVAVNVGSMVSHLLAAGRQIGLTAFIPRYSSAVVRGNFRYSKDVAGIAALASLQSSADDLLASRFLPLGGFAVYGFAASLASRCGTFAGALSEAAFPRLSCQSANAAEEAGRRGLAMQQLVGGATLPVFALVPFAAGPLFHFLFGPAGASMLLPATLLAFGYYVNGMLLMLYTGCVAFGESRIALRATTWSAGIGIPLAVLLTMKLGATGAALSWVVQQLLFGAVAVPLSAQQCFGTSAGAWLRDVAESVVPGFAVYGTAWGDRGVRGRRVDLRFRRRVPGGFVALCCRQLPPCTSAAGPRAARRGAHRRPRRRGKILSLMLREWTSACKQSVAEGLAAVQMVAHACVSADHSLPRLRTLARARRRSLKDLSRLQQLYELARRVDREGIEGDFVECGVYRGGSAMILADAMRRSSVPRHLWLFDSFTGLPRPSTMDGPRASALEGRLTCSAGDVTDAVGAVGIDAKRVHVVAGWFSDTLPPAAIKEIALVHVDSDWYDSVKLCLEQLYPALSPGGVILLDDYHDWPGCRAAYEEFVAQHAGAVRATFPSDRPPYLRREAQT